MKPPPIWIDVDDRATWITLKARLIAARWHAQGGRCGICGKGMAGVFKLGGGRHTASLDHVFPSFRHRNGSDYGEARPPGLSKTRGGRTIAAHSGCNSCKGHRAPTGCEMIWLLAVNARLYPQEFLWRSPAGRQAA